MRNYAEASAPGRVCLAGEDIDWISGPSILLAINLRIKAAAKSKNVNDGTVTFKTGSPYNASTEVPLDELSIYKGSIFDYSQASLKVLTDLGLSPKSMVLSIKSNLPTRAGLSSSAAVCIASLAALSDYYNLNLEDKEIANLAYKVESEELKTGAGQMDMYSSTLGGLIYSDSSTIPPKSIETYQLPEDLNIVIVDTLTPRKTGDVIREKRQRYELKEKNILRYVSETEMAIQQIRETLLIRPTDVRKLGILIFACHAYIRDFLQVSTDLIDDCVNLSMKKGAIGAKLTGTGMGGCMFALVPTDMTKDLVSTLQEKPVKIIVTQPSTRGLIRG